jgi:hypothetical protein
VPTRRSNPNIHAVEAASASPIVTTGETVIATLTGVSTDALNPQVILEGAATILTGTAATKLTLRVRVGALGGTVVGKPAEQFVGEAKPYTTSIQVVYAPEAELSGATFVLTAQQTAATTNGSAESASLIATS